jgi:S-methylmethionine-dependent homocysteine/selenocysteine methylase
MKQHGTLIQIVALHEGYARFAAVWHTAGASILGGCCGIGPEHITALRAGVTN